MPLAFQWSDGEPRVRACRRAPPSRRTCGSPAAPCAATCFGDEEEKIDDVLGRALELRPQRRILRRDAHRTGIEMALAHHDAAHRHQRRGGEAELFGAQQRGDHHIAAGLQFAIGLHADAAAQIVHHQHLLRFRQAEFPRNAGVLDANSAARRPCRRVSPEIRTASACALATPAATVPTPTSATSLTEMRAFGLTFLRS